MFLDQTVFVCSLDCIEFEKAFAFHLLICSLIILSIRPLDDLTFGTARDNGQRDSSDESEDSNDENNWRNEYPDTEEEGNDDDNSVDENDMRRAFNSMDMGKPHSNIV